MAVPTESFAGHPQRWLILGVLCAALCVIIIDETILYVALPVLFRELHATNAQMQWAVDAYVVLYAALLLPAGNLGDRYGRRTFLIGGLIVFALGSAAAAWAPSANWLIVARTVMAVGGGVIMPQTLSILSEVFSDEERGLAIGVWSGVAGIGIVAGPLLGGALVAHFWWGSIFLVNLPVIAVALLGTFWLLPNSRDRAAAPADTVGTVLGIVALLGFLSAIIEAPGRGLASPIVFGTGALGLAAGIAFVFVERSLAQPMLDFALFRTPRVVLCGVVILVTFAALQGTSYAFTQYVQFVQGRSALQTGLIFAPTTIGWSASAPFSPALVRRFSVRKVLVISMAINAACYVGYALAASHSPLWYLLTLCAVQGVAMGVAITPVTDLLMGALPRERGGIASALNDVARQVGGAVGVAVLGAILAATLTAHLGNHVADNLGSVFHNPHAAGADPARRAFIEGYRWVMFLGAAVIIVALPLVWQRSVGKSPSGGDSGSS